MSEPADGSASPQLPGGAAQSRVRQHGRARLGLAVLSGITLTVGVLALVCSCTALLQELTITQRVNNLVLCGDSESSCGGHIIYGLPNDLVYRAVLLLGLALVVAGFAVARARNRLPNEAGTATPRPLTGLEAENFWRSTPDLPLAGPGTAPDRAEQA